MLRGTSFYVRTNNQGLESDFAHIFLPGNYQYINATIYANSWINGEYSFESQYPHNIYDLEICGLQNTATTAQKTAFSNGDIRGNISNNVVKSCGTVPSIDIPVIIKVVINNGSNSF